MSDVEQWEHDEQRAMENEIAILRGQVSTLTAAYENAVAQHNKTLDELRASPASAPAGWKHSCNALCMDDVELWIPQCPHCGKPAPTPPVSEDRKDGERYRAIKNGDFSVEQFVSSSYGWRFVPTEELDSAIDAAMQEDKP